MYPKDQHGDSEEDGGWEAVSPACRVWGCYAVPEEWKRFRKFKGCVGFFGHVFDRTLLAMVLGTCLRPYEELRREPWLTRTGKNAADAYSCSIPARAGTRVEG